MKEEKIEVSKKEFLQFQIQEKTEKIEKLDNDIKKLIHKRSSLETEVKEIRANNRDVFPARGRKKIVS
jgi:chaperonin cofactor prefoldin